MKKNPGRRDRRRLAKANRTSDSAKRSAINERMLAQPLADIAEIFRKMG